MNNDANWEQVKEVFSLALEIEPEKRRAFVVARCSGDIDLQEAVLSWVDSYTESDDFIETPAINIEKIITNGSTQPGEQFGNYKMIREIGYGGMGAVFLAERADGEFSHQVAIKVIRQTLADSGLIERFKRERQILATLNHPNIAKLLDGGVTADGSPFIAMEYIEGDPLTSFADERKLDIRGRLGLFLKICSAVAFAHRNLIVHRDLKPSNILVTGDGEPKLLDFGLAKLVDENTSDDATRTITEFRALTPAYASPEQLRNEAITTVSDIYSLGVVLYELLSGSRPYDHEGKQLDEIIRTVSEHPPQPPSSIPSVESTSLKGDLDNIVLMALRREPERRYHSVEAFANDIDRYLNGLPVAARPLTPGYRLSKFIGRNRWPVAAASLLLLSLIGGLVATTWQTRAARREKEKAESINTFLEDTLKYSNPIVTRRLRNGQETTVSEALDEAAKRLDSGEFDTIPEVKAELTRMFSFTYYGQGRYTDARKYMAQYVEQVRSIYGENDPKMTTASLFWSGLLFERGEFDDSERTFRKYLPILRAEYKRGEVPPETLAGALNNFAYLRRTQGDSREAEAEFRETLELLPKLSGASYNAVATTRSTLASTIADQGRFSEALETAKLAVEELKGRGDENSPNYGFALTILGGFLAEAGDYENADADLAKGEAIFRQVLSPANLWIGDVLRNQASSLYGQSRFTEAIEKADASMKIYEEAFGKHYDQYPTALIVKGLSLTKLHRTAEGETALREAAELRTNALPAEHFWVALANSALGECLTIQKKYPEAEKLLTESFDSLNRSQGPENPRTLLAKDRLAKLKLAAAGL